MLDITLLRKDLPAVAAATRQAPQPLDVARFDPLEGERKDLQTRTEELQARRNACRSRSARLRARAATPRAAMAEVARHRRRARALGGELERDPGRAARA